MQVVRCAKIARDELLSRPMLQAWTGLETRPTTTSHDTRH